MHAGETLPAACHFSYFAFSNRFSLFRFFCSHVHIKKEGKINPKTGLNE